MFRVTSTIVVRPSRNVEREEDERMSPLCFDLYHIDRPVRSLKVRRQDGFYDSLKRRRIEVSTHVWIMYYPGS